MEAHRERRLVTCLFVDIVGSTDATLRHGPERMQRALSEAFTTMSSTIAAHGGTVEKYVGDAIFALFGVPTAHADDPLRALRAAMGCAAQATLAVRVGVETGEALVDLDAVEHRQQMAMGACVNLAARLQQHAEPGEILVGPICREATSEFAQFGPAGPLNLKGVGPVEAWRFIGFAAEGVRPVEFVGRHAELSLLGEAYGQARRGTATLALIIGPPGQGKTRLAREAIKAWGPQRLVEARCRPGTETGSNTPLRQLVTADVPDATEAQVVSRVSDLIGPEDGARVAAAVCHSAGIATDERLLALTRMEQREVIAEAWRRYLGALAANGETVVWVEDLHWADPVLLRIVDRVTTDLGAALLVVGTARPELAGSPHLRPRVNRLHIDLSPLDAEASTLLARLAGNGVEGMERAAGNPLFIVELARSRSRAGDIPLTIQGAIEARLDELEPADRELLQHVSVVGETFDIHDATLLGSVEPGKAAAALGRTAHLGFIVPVDARHRFHHALVRDVAYGRLPVAERMDLHARYAQDGVDPSDAEALAHHWWHALDPAEAGWVWENADTLAAMRRAGLAAHLAAGRRLEERNAYEESLEAYSHAVELADDAASRAEAEAAIGRAYARNGRGDEAWEHRLRAIELFHGVGAPAPGELYADMLEIAAFNFGYFQRLPDDAEVLRLLDEGEQVARAAGDDVSVARLLVERAAFTDDVTGTDTVVRLLDSPDATPFGDAAQRMAQVYLGNGEVARSLELSQAVFERLVPAGAIINEPEALLWYAMAALHSGDHPRADDLADRLLTESTRRSAHTRQHAYGLKAFIQLVHGDFEEVSVTRRDLGDLIDARPDAAFCLIGAAGMAYGAIADAVAGRPVPDDLDRVVARLVPGSSAIQTSAVMVPKVMAGDEGALHEGLRGYEPGLRLWDRQRFWDISDLMPSVALTMLQRWDELAPRLERLDAFARGGSSLAAAVAEAIREEAAASRGESPATHAELTALGYAGLTQLLRFRPANVT